MSDAFETFLASAVDVLRTEGFEAAYISAAVAAYRETLKEERDKAAEKNLRLSASPLSKVTSISSVDDPFPKESIGWQSRALKQEEPAPGGWFVIEG